MITSHIKLCPFCGAASRNIDDLKARTRAACETRICERIAAFTAQLAKEHESLAALHAVKAEDWRGALS